MHRNGKFNDAEIWSEVPPTDFGLSAESTRTNSFLTSCASCGKSRSASFFTSAGELIVSSRFLAMDQLVVGLVC